MRNIISAGTCSAIIAAATISIMAQAPSPQTTAPQPQTATQPPQTATNASSEKRVTVTGCLKPAPAATDTASAATGTAGTTGTTGAAAAAGATDADSAKFVLADAALSPSSEASTQTYRLIANMTALAPHVGKKLELTGTLVDESAAASTTASSGSGPVLKVEAGKVLAASCQN